jgi:signal transduction histidine kinase
VGGLMVWAVPPLLQPWLHVDVMPVGFERAVNLAKVIAAVGMIVLVLEEEIAANLAARQRDRRTRQEMERYTALYVTDNSFDEETPAYDDVCEAIAEVSRFSQALIFLQSAEGKFGLAGRAGVGRSLEVALQALGRRTTAAMVERVAQGEQCTAVAGSMRLMDLAALMEPGDDLEQMKFQRAYVMGIRTADGKLQGVLMASGLREPETPLSIEDVLPLELLVARIGAARQHAEMARRVTQAERLAGLGQLAGGVAHELNNPLQAVTGFAELLVDSEETGARRHAEVILSEARRMKQIIDSLLRFRSASVAERLPVSIGELLSETARLVGPELQVAHIDLQMKVPAELSPVRADAEQMRQVFVQVVRSAAEALAQVPPEDGRRIRVEVEHLPRLVHVVVSHNGPGFTSPARAFDPFFRALSPREEGDAWSQADERLKGSGQGLGLSVCYAIVREHGGAISAVNLHPAGAAVVIELPLDAEKTAGRHEGRDEARHDTGRHPAIVADGGPTAAR